MNTTSTPLSTPPPAASENKIIAIVSYLTLIGFIVAAVMHMSQKTHLGAYHLRQSLGLMLLAIAWMILAMGLMMIPFIGWLVVLCGWVALFILWVLGLVAAANGEMKPVPIVGEQIQALLGKAFD